jgi:hypothetical protein
VFAAFFVVGALATTWLPELRGRALEDDESAVGPATAAVPSG